MDLATATETPRVPTPAAEPPSGPAAAPPAAPVPTVLSHASEVLARSAERLRALVKWRPGGRKLRLAVGLLVLAVALGGAGVGFSGLLSASAPVTVTTSIVTTLVQTATVTATFAQTVPGATTTIIVTETVTAPPATACLSAPPTNSTTLAALVQVEIDPIGRGTSQVVYVTVCSAGWGIEGAAISGTVTDAAGNERPFSGTTKANGLYSYTWAIDANASPGTFSILVQAAKPGYTDDWGSTTFRVTL